jgi:hypothetical protein
VTCETLYRGKDIEFMQWLVVHRANGGLVDVRPVVR